MTRTALDFAYVMSGAECFVLTYKIFKFIVKKLIPNMPLIIPQHKNIILTCDFIYCVFESFFFLFCKFMKLRAPMQGGGRSLKWCKAWISCQTPDRCLTKDHLYWTWTQKLHLYESLQCWHTWFSSGYHWLSDIFKLI